MSKTIRAKYKKEIIITRCEALLWRIYLIDGEGFNLVLPALEKKLAAGREKQEGMKP